MLRQLRQLPISLAKKCQLLFGIAVVLIIGAALMLPWRRMEGLMEDVDLKAAAAVIDVALDAHTRDPSQASVSAIAPNVDRELPPRLIGRDRPDSTYTPFERRSRTAFAEDPDREYYVRTYPRADGVGLRLARTVYARGLCLNCHLADTDGTQALAAERPTLVVAQPKQPLGIVSVDIRSQVDPNQRLLNRVLFLVAGFLAGSMALLVFYLIISGLILKPVRVLQETAEKVSQGDVNIRSDISSGDEFQQLSETFNTMLTNLKQNADQLRAMNSSLDLKLGQMTESNLALFESNRLKSEFLANVSHELRTPLNSILGFAELLQDNPAAVSDPRILRYAGNILASGRSLLELINDLLDLAKIEAGRMEVRAGPLSLPDLFEGLTGILKPLTEPKNLTLDVAIAPDVPILQTDAGKLQQVLFNFLSNAIKFSPVGSTVTIDARRDPDDRIRISVTDRGPGIDPAVHQQIFEKFRQIDGSVTRQHSGTGLGLAISRELTRLLDGEIGVTSTPGEGSTFWIALAATIESSQQDMHAPLRPA